MSKPVFEDLFAFEGRRNRKSYFLYQFAALFVASIAWAALFGVSASAPLVRDTHSFELLGEVLVFDSFQLLAASPILAIAVSELSVSSQRIRDCGWTGWATIMILMPFWGFAFQIALMVIPGNRGDNKFGPDPLGGTASVPSEPTA